MSPQPPEVDVRAFIERWTRGEGGAERANYQLFGVRREKRRATVIVKATGAVVAQQG
ncbi:MAG: hypothetical protein ABI056_03875 [Caulobacteraceae bacterium]